MSHCRIRLINGDTVLTKHLKPSPLGEEANALFIDWLPTNGNDARLADDILTQMTALDVSIKQNIKTILFDRYLSITPKEHSWLIKHSNVILAEPALITRPHFIYMPFWTETFTIDELRIDDHDRPITLLYCGEINARIKAWEKYYIHMKTYYPDTVVAYTSEGLNVQKCQEYNLAGVNKSTNTYADAQYTIVIGSDAEYKRGYLDPNVFTALSVGCVPFLPEEHRYYRALPHVNPEGLHWYKDQYEYAYLGLMAEFYGVIDKSYPEMKVQSVVEQVYNLLS
jgi:hypothetical protein